MERNNNLNYLKEDYSNDIKNNSVVFDNLELFYIVEKRVKSANNGNITPADIFEKELRMELGL